MAKGDKEKLKKSAGVTLELFRLHRLNSWLASVYVLEAIAIFVFATGHNLPIIANYLAVNPINSAVAGHNILSAATRQLSDVNLTAIVIIYLLISAIMHFLLVTFYRKYYEGDLRRDINKLRWIDYAISSGLMLIIIALLSGIYDLGSLVMVFGFMVILNMLGLLMEMTNKDQGTAVNWWPYWAGAVAGIIPWFVIGLYAFNASYYGGSHIAPFVYWIYGTMFVCTIGFGLNMYLYYKKQGKWANYLYTERGFMILGLIVKTVLAWQVFAGVLRP